jgi:hypothetical protein
MLYIFSVFNKLLTYYMIYCKDMRRQFHRELDEAKIHLTRDADGG